MSTRAFDELLKNFMDSLGIPEKTVITEWERLAGKEMAAHVRVTDLSGGRPSGLEPDSEPAEERAA